MKVNILKPELLIVIDGKLVYAHNFEEDSLVHLKVIDNNKVRLYRVVGLLDEKTGPILLPQWPRV